MSMRLAMVMAVVSAGGQAVAADAMELAAGAPRFDNQVSINPLNLLYNEISLTYERRLTPSLSVYATPSGALNDMGKISETASVLNGVFGLDRVKQLGRLSQVAGGQALKTVYNQLGIDVGVRFYPRQDAISGLYLTPSIGYRHQFLGKGQFDVERFNVSAKVGRQWLVADTVVLNIAGGISYGAMYVVDLTSSGVTPDIQTSIGVPF